MKDITTFAHFIPNMALFWRPAPHLHSHTFGGTDALHSTFITIEREKKKTILSFFLSPWWYYCVPIQWCFIQRISLLIAIMHY